MRHHIIRIHLSHCKISHTLNTRANNRILLLSLDHSYNVSWKGRCGSRGGPGGPGPPLTLGFEAPKLSIFGPYLIFPYFFLPRFAWHIISLICCFFKVQIQKFSSLTSLSI